MKWVMAACLLLTALAGCAGSDAPDAATSGDPVAPPEAAYTLCGAVVDNRIQPIANATVQLDDGQTVQSDATGAFCFEDLDDRRYLVTIQHQERNTTTSWTPDAGDLRIVLAGTAPPEPFQQVMKFAGFMECGAEAVIISGSCDTLLDYANDASENQGGGRPLPEPLERSNEFDFDVDPAWQTIQVDVVFESQPGLDGLRAVLRGRDASDDLSAYEQYGRWYDAESFTFQVAPGGNYTYGDGPIPFGQDVFQLEVLPHSYGYHAVCDPDETNCFLGGGIGYSVAFEVIVTAFIHEAA